MVKGEIAVVGEHHFTMGFLFAGMLNVFTVSNKKGEEKLSELIDSKNYSVIFISETLNEMLDWRMKKKVSALAYPVVVPLPDITGESSEAANIKALIKRALGFDLMSKE
ncbi:hypothetical protein KJ780_00635 [Candidatus Micrarchaeota archaeon]|nr:hypothetical protein [Candidatus Micrarchaeota archaeon]